MRVHLLHSSVSTAAAPVPGTGAAGGVHGQLGYGVAIAVGVLVLVSTVMLASDRKSTRLNSSHSGESRMPSSA